jgi:hypothetical protein
VNHSLNDFVDLVCLSEASIEAFDIVSSFNALNAGLSELQVASVSTVVENRQISLDLEALKLQSL